VSSTRITHGTCRNYHLQQPSFDTALPRSRRGKVTGPPCLHTERGIDTHAQVLARTVRRDARRTTVNSQRFGMRLDRSVRPSSAAFSAWLLPARSLLQVYCSKPGTRFVRVV
jgi:hypothetical protein